MEKFIFTQHQKVLLELLRDIRGKAKLRQEDVAAKLSRPQSFVSKYESGERRLDILELREVCQALGISLAKFVSRLERKLQEIK